MDRIVLFLLATVTAALFGYVSPVRDFTCPESMVWSTCVSSRPPTCEEPNPISLAELCTYGCACPPGKVQRRNGMCIAPEDCNSQLSCLPGQIWNDCGSPCPATCGIRNPKCDHKCVPSCECPAGTVMKRDGSCIPPESCPIACPPGHVWNDCASPCNHTCEMPRPMTPECTDRCVPRCECAGVRVVNSNGECIPMEDCVVCPHGQVWNNCGEDCDRTCSNKMPTCQDICCPRCQCHKGQVMSAKGCVDETMC